MSATSTTKSIVPINDLPSTTLLRQGQIIGDSDTEPLIPIGRTAWFTGIKAGRYPEPVKLPGSPLNFWRAGAIRELLESVAAITRVTESS